MPTYQTTPRALRRLLPAVAMLGVMGACGPELAVSPSSEFARSTDDGPFIGAEQDVDMPLIVESDARFRSADSNGSVIVVIGHPMAATRVTTEGEFLDAVDISLGLDTVDLNAPVDVATDGERFMVASFCGPTFDSVVCGAILDDDGAVSAVAPFEWTASSQQSPISVAAAIDGFAVAWAQRGGGDQGVYLARVNASGTTLDPEGVLALPFEYRWDTPSVLSDGADFWVMASGSSGSVIRRVSGQGEVVGDAPTPLDHPVTDAVWSDDALVGIWANSSSSSFPSELWVGRMDATGAELEPPVLVATGTPRSINSAQIVRDVSGELVVSWLSRGSWFGQRLSGQAAVLGDPVFLGSSPGTVLVADDGLATFFHSNAFDPELGRSVVRVRGTWFDASGQAVGDVARVIGGRAFNTQYAPDIASTPDGALVVWTDSRSGLGEVYGSLLTSDGALTDTAGVPVATAVSGSGMRNPAVGSDGTDYLVTWVDGRRQLTDIWATPVSAGGIASTPFEMATTSTFWGSGADGLHAPVTQVGEKTWVATPSGLRTFNVVEGLQSAGGLPIQATDLVATPTGALVVGEGSEMVRVDTVGSVGVKYVFNDSGTAANSAQIARGDEGSLVVWLQTAFGRTELRASIMDDDGVPQDGDGVVVTRGNDASTPAQPAVAYSGGEFLVVWSDESASDSVVRGTRVLDDGTVLDPDGFEIGHGESPALSSLSNGTFILGYSADSRVRIRVVGAPQAELGLACTNNTDCVSGFCVDDVCCDAACGEGAPNDCMACQEALTGQADGLCSPLPALSTCGDGLNDACTAPDTCDDAGACLANDALAGSPCGDQSADCRVDDTCDGSGICVDNGFADAGTTCGSDSATTCDPADTCSSNGVCQPNLADNNTVCDDGVFCTTQDTCNAGVCVGGPLSPCADGETCQEEPQTCAPPCGDGVVSVDEQCDDGTGNSDIEPDACRSNCVNPSCGDGVVDRGEDCDDGDTPGGCRADCTLPVCGDGIVDDMEDCDLGEANSNEPGAECRPDCSSARCGDDIRDPDEECDLGDDNADFPDACRTTCMLPVCGDGIIDRGEDCDDGDANTDDGECPSNCETLTSGCDTSGSGLGWLGGVLALFGMRRRQQRVINSANSGLR